MKTFLKSLETAIKANWDKAALCNFRGEHFSFGEVAESIERLHIFYDESGLKEGDKIAICAKNSARWAISFLSIITNDAVAVPLLADFNPESIANLVHHSESRILFTDPDIWAKMDKNSMPGLKCAINARDFTLIFSADEKTKSAFENISSSFNNKYPLGFTRESVNYRDTDGKKLAVINYTSGTTSAPKGVMIRHECISDMTDFSTRMIAINPDDQLVSMLPLAHMYGLAIELLYPISNACTIFFLGKTPSPTLLMSAMKEVKPCMVAAVPLVMEKIYKSSLKPVVSKWYMAILLHTPIISGCIYSKMRKKLIEAFGGRVRNIIMGGAALNPEVERCFKKMKLPYTVGYGMTEASPLLAYEDWRHYKPGSCGKAVHEIRIDSEDPQHIAGEIQARGTNICSGYFNNPEANAMAFTEDGWLRTGDLGIIDTGGNIFIKGRSKSMILSSSGQNIYPEEIEACLNNCNYVAESVAVDRAGKIVALIYLDKDAIKKDKLDPEAIADIPENARLNTNKHLPSYSQIAKIEVMPTPFEKTPKMSIKRFLYK